MPKILIIRFSSIGDIVLTSPVIRCISKQVQDVEVHFLTKQSFASIVEANPYVKKVYAIHKQVSEVMPLLKSENYDFVVDLHHNLRSWQVMLQLNTAHQSFPKLNYEKWLLVQFKLNKLPATHIVDRYMTAAAPLHVNNDLQGIDFFIPTKHEVALSSLPENFRKGYVALVIGAQHFTKRLPNHKLIALCNQMHLPVVLIGGKDDYANAAAIENQCGNLVFNACGQYNLFQSASLIRQASLVITHDTGMMHIAAAFQKKTISVWGNTVPEFGMYPYLPMHAERSYMAEVKNLNCRPCSKIGKTACPKGHFKCMEEIDIDIILKQAVLFTT